MITINVADHYWSIAESEDVYQSKTNTMVPVDNEDYVAHGLATPIASEAELAVVLQQRGSAVPMWLLLSQPTFIQPTPDTYSEEQLKSYSADARWRKMQGGIVVNGISFPTDQPTLSALNASFILTQTNAASTFSWKLPDGTFVTLDKQGVQDLQRAVTDFGKDCFACEDHNADDIDAGSITDLAAIDAEYAAISNSFTGAVQRRK